MPFKSEKQRRYMHANEPEIAEEWENHGGAYPAPANFNPGGDDATMTNEITTQRDQRIDGTGPNGIRDHEGDGMYGPIY